jgi:hypothetical protein
MAQNSSYICCGTVSIEELSSHFRTLPAEKLSSHIEQCKAVLQLLMDLLFSRLQHALAQHEANVDSEAYGDSDVSAGGIGNS